MSETARTENLREARSREASTATAFVSYVESLIDARDLERAERYLLEDAPLTARLCDARRLAHQRARLAFFRGRWNESAQLLAVAIDEHGPHVGALSDLCSSLYLAGRSADWLAAVERFRDEFRLARPLLSPIHCARTELTLGKHLEEAGLIADALELYQQARAAHEEPSLKLSAAAQLLRLESFLGNRKRAATLYAELCGPRPASLSRAFAINLEHALMSAEAREVGPLHAFTRLQELREKGLGPADMRLAVFDFVEAWLTEPGTVGAISRDTVLELIEEALAADAPDAFEESIAKIARDGLPDRAQLNSWLAWMPVVGALRTLATVAALETDSLARGEMKRRMLFLIAGLEPRSARLLESRWSKLLRDHALDVDLDSRTRKVLCDGRQLSFARRSTSFEILTALAERPNMSMHEFVRRIWSAETDNAYYDRARVAIRRLNRELAPLAGNARIIELAPDRVNLAQGARFRVITTV